jgi:hypothetical protein
MSPTTFRPWFEVVLAALPAAAQQFLEDLMATDTFQFQSNYARKLRARGEADALLEFLDARGIEVTDDIRGAPKIVDVRNTAWASTVGSGVSTHSRRHRCPRSPLRTS